MRWYYAKSITQRRVIGEEFLKVSGFGKAKLERFGEEFLKAIKEFRKCESITEICAEVERNYEIGDVTVDVFLQQVNALLKAYGKQNTMESVWGCLKHTQLLNHRYEQAYRASNFTTYFQIVLL